MDQTSLFKALAAAQADVQAQGKDSTNTFHKYKYTSMEDLLIEARRVLTKHGLAASIDDVTIVPGVPYDAKEIDKDGHQITVTYRDDVLACQCTLRHESGESFSCQRQQYILPEKGRPPDKALATANTFAIGYWLRDLLLIPRVDDEPDKRDDTKYAPPRRQTQPRPQEDHRKAAVMPSRESVIPQPPPAATNSGASPAMKDDQVKVAAACKAIAEATGISDLLKLGTAVRKRESEGAFSASTARNILEGSLEARLVDLAQWALDAAKAESDIQDVITPVTKAFKDKIVSNGTWGEIMKMATNAKNRLGKSMVDEANDFFSQSEEEEQEVL